jgi:hypothetical protein
VTYHGHTLPLQGARRRVSTCRMPLWNRCMSRPPALLLAKLDQLMKPTLQCAYSRLVAESSEFFVRRDCWLRRCKDDVAVHMHLLTMLHPVLSLTSTLPDIAERLATICMADWWEFMLRQVASASQLHYSASPLLYAATHSTARVRRTFSS